MKPIIIGLVGEKGGGKETFVKILKKILSTTDILHIRSSDILYEAAECFGYERENIKRAQLQELAKQVDNIFGKGSITRGVKSRLIKGVVNIRIFDGVRWPTDVKMIRSLPNSYIIYITADAEIRWRRAKKRKQKAGEGRISWKQFMREEKASTEIYIPKISKGADFKIDNNRTIKELESQIKAVMRKIHKAR